MLDLSIKKIDGDADPDAEAEAEPEAFDDPELLQPTASSATVRPAVAVTVIRPRRGDLIDAPNVDNGGEAVAWSIGAGGQRPALKLAPRAKAKRSPADDPPASPLRTTTDVPIGRTVMARHNYYRIAGLCVGGGPATLDKGFRFLPLTNLR